MILAYAVILERVKLARDEAQRIYNDDPTPEHAVLVKELTDPLEHLKQLVRSVDSGARRGG